MITFPDVECCPTPRVTSFTPKECVSSPPNELRVVDPLATLDLADPAPPTGQTVVVQIGTTATVTFVFSPGQITVAGVPIVGVLPAPLPATAFFTIAPLRPGCQGSNGQVAIL